MIFYYESKSSRHSILQYVLFRYVGKKIAVCADVVLVRRTGLEPARDFSHNILSVA